jgi:sulfatase maturation enzyme AslB (radical SAM superfamily)
MYNKGDLSYLQQPRVMPVAVADAAIERIQAYSSASGTRQVSIVLHGGEPLLAGQTFFAGSLKRRTVSSCRTFSLYSTCRQVVRFSTSHGSICFESSISDLA